MLKSENNYSKVLFFKEKCLSLQKLSLIKAEVILEF